MIQTDIDANILLLLTGIVRRFMTDRTGTSVRKTRTALIEKRNALIALQTEEYLQTLGDWYFPTFKLVAESSHDIERLAFERVNLILTGIRNLYIKHNEKNEFSLDEILGEMQRFNQILTRTTLSPVFS